MTRQPAAARAAARLACAGVDYDRMFSPREAQLASLRMHVGLAVELKMPMFIHERAPGPARATSGHCERS